MSATITQPHYEGLDVVGAYLPDHFELIPDEKPQGAVLELVERYQAKSLATLHGSLPSVEHDQNGLSFATSGEASEVLILLPNAFGHGLRSPDKRLRGLFLHDSLRMHGVVDADGRTPQVVQIGMASRDTNIPLRHHEHRSVHGGNVMPIADKIAELVFRNFPESQRIITIGYSLAGFLTPDILMSLLREKDAEAGLIANPPGVRPEPMTAILGKFAHAATHMHKHIAKGGLQIIESPVHPSKFAKINETVGSIADIASHPVNFSLWHAFSRGKLLKHIQMLNHVAPRVQLKFAFGYEDPLCSPHILAEFLKHSGHETSVIENGDHAWGYNLPRSMGHLATQQISKVLAEVRDQPAQLALAA